jgi:hypothetical protein
LTSISNAARCDHKFVSERYATVDFQGSQGPYWLPASAVIEVETPHQHWRNPYTFSRYKRFSVDVKSSGDGEMSVTAGFPGGFEGPGAELNYTKERFFGVLLCGAFPWRLTALLKATFSRVFTRLRKGEI